MKISTLQKGFFKHWRSTVKTKNNTAKHIQQILSTAAFSALPFVSGGRTRNKIPTFVFAMLALMLFGTTTTFAQTLPLRANGKIAFTSDRTGFPKIYVMNNDGTEQVRLTNNNDLDCLPAFSPDGRKIAFISQQTSAPYAVNIKIMNADGTKQTELTPVTLPCSRNDPWAETRSLSWSPDGSRIVFDDAGEIFTVNVDGSNRTNLTNHPAQDKSPAWSPDGSRILFTSSRVPYSIMLTMNTDGTDVQMLPSVNQNLDVSPDWSPYGDKIVFVQESEIFLPGLYIANADGRNRKHFEGTGSSSDGGRYKPKWSPDAAMIVFSNCKFNLPCQIYVKNVNGGGVRQLTETTGNNFQPSWQPLLPARTFADFDGDGRADVSVFRPTDRVWYLNQSTNGFSATQFGLSTDKITPGDFDGDGKTDISIFRDGVWWRLESSNGAVTANQFGAPGDIPVPADYTGDGRDELAVYRNGVWWIHDLSNDKTSALNFGLDTDLPVPADFDGDGRVDQAVFRHGGSQLKGNSEWHLNRSAQGYAVVQFGLSTDTPVAGDFDGDGKTDPAVYGDGTWHVLQSGQGYKIFQWGLATDIPAPADYDGDGRTDAAVYRDGVWYLLQSASGISIQQFGSTNDVPVPAALLP